MNAGHREFVRGNRDGNNGPEQCQFNPAVSRRQQRFMGAELARKRAGKATETGMTEQELRDFARR